MMGKVKELWVTQIETVFENLIRGDISEEEAYYELLRLGYDEDKAYEEVYELAHDDYLTDGIDYNG